MNTGNHNRMAPTAINDNWKPISKSERGFTISIKIAVNANVFNDILSLCPNDNNAYTVNMIAERTTLADSPTRKAKAQIPKMQMICDNVCHRLPTTRNDSRV